VKDSSPPSDPLVAVTTDLADWRVYPPLELPRILQVALTEVVQHGYDATSIRTIAREVGVTVPALYYHYENKQAMLVALLDRAMGIVLGHCAAALRDAGDDPVRRLSALVEAIVLYMAHHSDLAFLDSERRSLTPGNRARYFDQRNHLGRWLQEAITDGADRGLFATDVPGECSRAVLSMCQGIASWYRRGGPVGPEAMAQRYVRIALAAVEYHGTD
jgi:AcrR family transcriptional regulator